MNTKVSAILIWNLFMGIFQYEFNRRANKGGDYLKSTLDAAVDFVLHSLKSD